MPPFRIHAVPALIAVVSMLVLPIHGDVTIRITVQYPQSNLGPGISLGLRGNYPLSWEATTALAAATTADTWTASVVIPTSICNASNPTWQSGFKVVAVDGSGGAQWELGANHRLTIANTEAPSVEFTIYPYFMTAQGATQTLSSVHSPQLNNTRDVWLYIPPVMVENPYAWADNVLVMHDGQNLQPTPNSPPDYMGNWSVATHIDAAINAQEISQVFVIGPYNTGANRIFEYTYSRSSTYGGGGGDLYLDFLETTLIPLVAGRFQIRTNQANLGIMGSSLGGLISCYAGITRPHVYRTVGCMSSSFWWNNGDFLGTIVPQLSTTAGTQQFYVDSGDSGDSDDDVQDTSAVSTAFIVAQKGLVLGQNFYWYLQRGGQHNEVYWSERFHHPLQWLYGFPAIWNDGIQSEGRRRQSEGRERSRPMH